MKFSLIFCTINREKECAKFFSFLEKQTYANFELLIIDQNIDRRVDNLIQNYPTLVSKTNYIKSELKGLSRARNLGLKHCTGDIICFPDDDCWYGDQKLLERINKIFHQKREFDGISIPWCDEFGNLCGLKWPKCNILINKKNVFNTSCSLGIFLKNTADIKSIRFNEILGAGSGTKFGSGEETDFLLQILNLNKKLLYVNTLSCNHPAPPKLSEEMIKKMTSYSYGFGYVLRKHDFSKIIVLKFLIRPIIAFIISILCFKLLKANFYFNIFKARSIGYFFDYKRAEINEKYSN